MHLIVEWDQSTSSRLEVMAKPTTKIDEALKHTLGL
jgi:hypothetical protein